MLAKKIKQDIFWVGAVDWDLREFHGYETSRGSSYNSYLVVDEKIVLVDAVKEYKFDEMLVRIKTIVDPAKIDFVVVNHVEMDHSGSLPKIMELAKNAKIITNSFGIKGLKKHFPAASENWEFVEVKTGDCVNIGKRNLKFVQMQMVHWPDSMATYLPEDKILMPNDAFGQHFASFYNFDDEVDFGILMHEAKKYYANIVLPFGAQVQKALADLGVLDIEIICPSHGLIWRKFIPEILAEYQKWSKNITTKKAVIIYDTMWQSTEKIARAVYEAFEAKGITAVLCNLKTNHISDVMTEIVDAEYICVGSPTLNNNMLPSVAGFLTYLKGLAPKNRKCLAFGSFGWGGQSIGLVSSSLKDCGFSHIGEDIKVNYVPHDIDLEKIKSELEKVL